METISNCNMESISKCNMESISNSNLLLNIIEYLSINDTYIIILLNKNIFNNINKIELKYILKNITNKLMIYKSIKNYVNILKYIPNSDNYINEQTPKSLALYYYKNYPKNCISSFYNMDMDNDTDLGSKSVVIRECKNKYNLKKTNIPSRYDLYCLVKNMSVDETSYIGW